MIRINLLPFRADRKKESSRNKIYFAGLALLGFIGCLFWVHVYLNGKIKSLNTEIAATQKEVDRYKKIVREVNELEEKLKVLEEKLKVISTLKSDRDSAFRLTDVMTDMVIENRMWLVSFEAKENIPVQKKGDPKKEESKEPPKITVDIRIDGIALDNKTVADFMTRIENAEDAEKKKLFANIKLVTLEQDKIDQGKDRDPIYLKKFQVECQKALPVPEKKEEAKKKEEPKKQ